MRTLQGQREPAPRLVTSVAYLVLFVFGAVQGLIGSFSYSRGPGPLVAIIFDVVIFATCVLAGWGMGTFGGGLVPAVGWVLTTFVLSMPRANGSLIIANTTAGKWYLYGGSLLAAAGALAAFTFWGRPRPRR